MGFFVTEASSNSSTISKPAALRPGLSPGSAVILGSEGCAPAGARVGAFPPSVGDCALEGTVPVPGAADSVTTLLPVAVRRKHKRGLGAGSCSSKWLGRIGVRSRTLRGESGSAVKPKGEICRRIVGEL